MRNVVTRYDMRRMMSQMQLIELNSTNVQFHPLKIVKKLSNVPGFLKFSNSKSKLLVVPILISTQKKII